MQKLTDKNIKEVDKVINGSIIVNRYIGRELATIREELDAAGISYEVVRTDPNSRYFRLDDERLYIVRQTKAADGGWLFVVASKMRKEVQMTHGLQN